MRAVGVVLAVAVVLALPACRFSRDPDDLVLPTTSSSLATTTTIALEDLESIAEETPTDTTVAAATPRTTARRSSPAATARRSSPATTAVRSNTAPVAAPSPFCTVSVSPANAPRNSSITVTLRSSFPQTPFSIQIRGQGYSGSISNITGNDGSYTTTSQQAAGDPGARTVTASVGGRTCGTGFNVV